MAVYDSGLCWGGPDLASLYGWGSPNTYRAKLTEGGPQASSATITPDGALQLATVWACVRLLAETVATLPLGVYRKDGKGQRQAANGHGLYALLHDSPNADMTAAEWLEADVACLGLWGNAYSQKARNGRGDVVALDLRRPDRMVVARDASGARVYRYTHPGGAFEELPESEVFHVRGFGTGLDVGLSPIGCARHTLMGARAADAAARQTFESGLQLAGFIEAPAGIVKDDQREQIRQQIQRFAGSANAGGFMVLEQGMKFSPLGINPEDAQLLETRAFAVEEICRWFRVPPFMIGHSEKSTSWGTGLEQQMLGFLTFALRPYLVRIEQAVKKQLASAADRAGGVYAEFTLEGLMRADSAGRAALYASASQNGWMTRNEIRNLENLPPVAGGDLATAQVNLAPLEKLGELPIERRPGLKALEDMGAAANAVLGIKA